MNSYETCEFMREDGFGILLYGQTEVNFYFDWKGDFLEITSEMNDTNWSQRTLLLNKEQTDRLVDYLANWRKK